MLFHLGALWRLNELGLLGKLDRVSSVSGGSITAGVLGQNWEQLTFGADGVAANFEQLVAQPIRSIAGKRVDVPAILLGLLLPGSIASWVARAYRRHLFADATLQSLPDHPRFVINATNLQSGVLFRFSKPYLWDWKVGQVKRPDTQFATAVAASSAFPPFLSPLILRLPKGAFTPGTGDGLDFPPYTTRIVLTDGGVYDNLGLETVWKSERTILVSDGGGQLGPKLRPPAFWPTQLLRVVNTIDSQVRSLRKRQLIDGFGMGLRKGTYWGIRSDIGNYGVPDALPCPPEKTAQLASVPTRLTKTPPLVQEQLINWGYAICDVAIRKWVEPGAQAPTAFPYPKAGVG